MKNYIALALILLSGCATSLPAPESESPVIVAPSPSPGDPGAPLVTISPKSTVDKTFLAEAVGYINSIEKCVKDKAAAYSFDTFENEKDVKYKNGAEAFAAYARGKPYEIEFRWYNTSSGIVGYTYQYYLLDNGGYDKNKSEVRIWSNKNNSVYYNAKWYAAHIYHELSHQLRAGGFGHWTKRTAGGSYPYVMGYLADECLGN